MDDRLTGELARIEGEIRQDPGNAELYWQRARIFDELQQHERAIQDIDEAARLDPAERASYLFKRHQQLVKLNRLEEAMANIRESALLAPGNGFQRFVAELHQKMGNADLGVQYLDEALRQRPGDGFLLARRGKFLANLGRLEAALRDLTAAIDLMPNEDQVYFRKMERIDVLIGLKRFEEALADANWCIKKGGPRNSSPYSARGRVFQAMGKPEYAKANFDRAMNITMDR